MQAGGKSGGGRAELVRRGQVRLEEVLRGDGGRSGTGVKQEDLDFCNFCNVHNGQVEPFGHF